MDHSLAPGVPESVRPVHTPLIPTAWGELLSSYPDQRLVQFFLRGITEGFKLVTVIVYLKVLGLPEKIWKEQYSTQKW